MIYFPIFRCQIESIHRWGVALEFLGNRVWENVVWIWLNFRRFGVAAVYFDFLFQSWLCVLLLLQNTFFLRYAMHVSVMICSHRYSRHLTHVLDFIKSVLTKTNTNLIVLSAFSQDSFDILIFNSEFFFNIIWVQVTIFFFIWNFFVLFFLRF